MAITATTTQGQTTDTVRTYLNEIGRTRLLTHEEEISLGRQVQAMMKLHETKQAITNEQGREPSLEEWAEQAGLAISQLKTTLLQGERAKKRMIQANLRLVVNVAKKYPKQGMELLDLIQEGSIGLARAVEKFDPTLGYKFSTYAYWWIRQAINRAIAAKSHTIHIPIHISETLNKTRKARRMLSQELGRTPSLAEVANAVEVDPQQLNHWQSVIQQPLSIDLRTGNQDDLTIGGLLAYPGDGPEEYAERANKREHLEQLLVELTPQQREALSLRYGLDGGQEMTLAKVGKCMGVSRERVRQLEAAALKQLRNAAKERVSAQQKGC